MSISPLKRPRTSSPSNAAEESSGSLRHATGKIDSEKMFQARLSSAIDLRKAIDNIKRLKSLGHCPALVESYNADYEDSSDSDKKATHTQKLVDVYNDFPVPNSSGKFKSPFNLHVTRPGCEYDEPVEPSFSTTIELIPKWFENSTVSGYGDNRTLETKVDHKIRSAREILPSEFSVEPELVELIQKTWAEHFIPARVRAEPYKIHIYGPGGHFKSHCDTPEKGLVGTFLVGLGDTASFEAQRQPPGRYRVQDLSRGADDDATKLPLELGQRLKEGLDRMQPPYGILLDHKYCIGTSEMSGFDSLLLASARMRADVDVHVLPVVTKFHGEREPWENGDVPVVECKVYPLTEAHVDILLKRNMEMAKDIKWLNGLCDIPFFSLDFASSVYTWHRERTEGAEYVGNGSEAAREDSIYLSYAMLVLDANHDASKDDLKGVSESDAPESSDSD